MWPVCGESYGYSLCPLFPGTESQRASLELLEAPWRGQAGLCTGKDLRTFVLARLRSLQRPPWIIRMLFLLRPHPACGGLTCDLCMFTYDLLNNAAMACTWFSDYCLCPAIVSGAANHITSLFLCDNTKYRSGAVSFTTIWVRGGVTRY
jgi:hypothetical protein